ncbi:hypothetical protein ACLMJK_009139 [Lecanora helva]
MPLSRSRSLVFTFTAVAILGLTIFTLNPLRNGALRSTSSITSKKISTLISSIPASFSKPEKSSEYAFVAFLEGSGDEESEDAEEEEDGYYTATRVLGYQLLHAPSTRSPHIPFLLLTTNVSSHRRTRLQNDGFTVLPIAPIPDPDWLHTSSHYHNIMTKLRVFELTNYTKLLYLDSDMLITRPLHGIFADPATTITPILENATTIPGEAPLPTSYMLAAQAQQTAREHPYPPLQSQTWFCSGFFLFAPSTQLFTYYAALLTSPGKFTPDYPDQNLLNYAHRPEGPMPWTRFNYTWTTTFPTIREYEAGAASLHEKYWLEEYRTKELGQDVLGGMWLGVKREMEEFYGE